MAPGSLHQNAGRLVAAELLSVRAGKWQLVASGQPATATLLSVRGGGGGGGEWKGRY